MGKQKNPIEPKRGYEWIGYVWIAAIAVVLIVNILIDGQFTLGEPDGVLIKANERPLVFWAGVAFPGLIFIGMIVLLIRGELQHRDRVEVTRQIAAEDARKK
ncbi:hypothetical protein N8553_03475 [bacterium]|jgi:hypothetical protein|nr:hypothetical protein [Planctomicrobium sp.]MDA7504022.1 hypothetical protein [bacterium]